MSLANARNGGERRERPHARHAHQPRGRFVGSRERLELAVVPRNASIKHPKVLEQIIDGTACKRWKAFADTPGHTAHFNRSIRKHLAELREKPTHPIDRRGPFLDKALPHPVKAQHRLLLDALHRYKAHRWTLDRLADRLGVIAVVLAATPIRRYEPRRHDPDRVPKGLKLARPIVRAGARLEADHARRALRHNRQQSRSDDGPSHQHIASLVDGMDAEHVLCEIDPDGSNLARDFPS